MTRKAAVRQRILEAAILSVERHGPGGLRIHDVCEAAVVSAPIVYRHFGSREGLVEEVQVERYLMSLRRDAENFRAAAAACASPAEMRQVVAQSVTAVLRQNREARWRRLNVMGSAFARPELERRLVEEQDHVFREIAETLDESQARGLISATVDVWTAAIWQHGLLFSRVFFERGSQLGDLDTWDRYTVEAIIRLVCGDAEAGGTPP